MKRYSMFGSFFQPCIGISAIALIGALTGTTEAIITDKDSSLFGYKFEMDNVGQGIDPDGSTAQYTRSAGGTFSASLSNVPPTVLNYDTTGGIGNGLYWTSTQWASPVINPAVGWTIEIRLRVDAAEDNLGLNRAFNLVTDDTAKVGVLEIGTDRTIFSDAGVSPMVTLGFHDNTDDFHVFRMAKDGGASVYQVWRDGIQIGTNVNLSPGWTIPLFYQYFGDGSSGISGKGSIDYLRWDETGAFAPVAIPEPSSVALIGLGGLAFVLRRADRCRPQKRKVSLT